MPMANVLVIEDDEAIRRGIVDALTISGYEALEAGDGEAGAARALDGCADLVLLDVLLPRLDGFEVLRRIRQARPALPVIMLTARGTEEDRVRGLRGGADDYIVKPFGASELLARVEAVLRRSPGRPSGCTSITVAGRRIDFDRREATLPGGATAPLSQKEADLLAYLAAHADRAVTREELLANVWGIDPRGVQTRTVDMHVARLRESLADDPADPAIILTVRAKGYMLGPLQDGAGREDAAEQ